jgi:flavin-dependent dehydrogenase
MKPIVIAGAGIGGLSAAIALARHGFAVRVYERVAQLREFGAGIHVQQTASEMGEIYHADGQAREARNKALAARDPDDHEPNAWLFGTDGPRDTTSTTSFFGRVR